MKESQFAKKLKEKFSHFGEWYKLESRAVEGFPDIVFFPNKGKIPLFFELKIHPNTPNYAQTKILKDKSCCYLCEYREGQVIFYGCKTHKKNEDIYVTRNMGYEKYTTIYLNEENLLLWEQIIRDLQNRKIK